MGRPWWLWPAAVLGALVLLFVLLTATAGFWANLWWFSSLGFRGVLITRYVAVALSFLVGFAVAAVFVGINLWVALRSEGGIGLTVGDVTIGRRFSILALIGATIVLSGLFALSVASEWELFLRFLNRTPFGVTDPQFHQDVSFYVFTLPVLDFWRSWLMSLIVLTAIGVAAVYAAKLGTELMGGTFRLAAAYARASLDPRHDLPDRHGARLLDQQPRTRLLDARRRRGRVVYGCERATPRELHPARHLTRRGGPARGQCLPAADCRCWSARVAVWIVAAVLIGSAYPAAVQSVSVRPNELGKERPYIDAQHRHDAAGV